jgi:heme exporter protein A
MNFAVENLAVGRGGVALLEGVNLTLSPGGFTLLQGPNGAGKTTLLRVLAGLAPPLAGKVDFPPDQAVYAGHLDGVKARLTLAENLSFWQGLYGASSALRAKAETRFRLAPLAGRLAGRLSAGQKRRLGLSRLLLAARPLWLLDEPNVSLDAEHRGLFAEVLAQHLAGGGAALIASHVEIGLEPAQVLDLAAYRARPPAFEQGAFA